MIYIMVFLLSVFFAYLAEKSKNKGIIILCSVISILIPSILGGLRVTGVGVDSAGYGIAYVNQAIRSKSFSYFFEHNETDIFYRVLTYFVANIFGNENWCYFAYQLITISCVYIGAWKHKKITSPAFIMLLFYLLFYNTSYNLIRQSIATSVVFAGLTTLEKREYGKFILCTMLATCFHKSAVLSLIILSMHAFVTSSKFKYSYFFRFVSICAFLVFLLFFRTISSRIVYNISFFSKYIHFFIDGNQKINNSSFMIMCGQIIMLTLFYGGANKVFSKLDKHTDNIAFYKLNIFFYLGYSLLIGLYSMRILMYSYYVNLIVLASLHRFVKERYLKIIVAFVVLVALSFSWWNNVVNINSANTWPYRSIL